MASDPGDAAVIGARARTIRRRRGLSLEVAAGLAGISKPYLSMLERGERRFQRRGLLEDLAGALGCAVADLTGTPYLPGDRDSADALATLPPISIALHDSSLDDVPDVAARPVADLVRLARMANAYSADSRYSLAGRHLGDLLIELHVHAVTGDTDTRRSALAGLVEACFVAAGNARSLGNHELAVHAARRSADAAARLESPALSAFAAMTSTGTLSRLGARHRAERVAADALDEIEPIADPGAADTTPSQAAGMLHLSSAQLAAKRHDSDRAGEHLRIAAEIAARTGERNELQFMFGPANVRAWSLSVAVELGQGPERAEALAAMPGYDADLPAADRRSALHFDMARAYGQAEGARDHDVLRHLDLADRIAPQRLRHDPVARELVGELDGRTRRRAWELDSLKRRFYVG